jgi:hypothetical protein
MMLWPENPALSVLFLLVTLILFLYGARAPAHRGIVGAAKALNQGCKLTAQGIRSVQERLAARNREVLLSEGLEDAERQIDQEFQRISSAVDRDLGGYPALHRRLSDQVARIDEDYRRVTDTPPAPDSWTQTLHAAGELVEKAGTQPAAAKAVQALQTAIEQAHDDAMDKYRQSSRDRHDLLAKMVPAWRSMSSTLTRVEKSV